MSFPKLFSESIDTCNFLNNMSKLIFFNNSDKMLRGGLRKHLSQIRKQSQNVGAAVSVKVKVLSALKPAELI